MSRRWGAGVVAVVLAGLLAGCASPAPERSASIEHDLQKLPVSFVANHGSWDSRASWVAAGREATAYFVDAGVRWALPDWALDQTLVGARPARPTASRTAAGTVSYFGESPATALPTATELTLDQAWPGIDVTWAGAGGHIEATYHLAAGADPAQVRVAWQGATSLAVTPEGRLAVHTPVRTFEEDAPKAFQHVAGRRVPVDVAYQLLDATTYGFRLGAYDRARPLVIDPAVLLYASFLGGSSADLGYGIAVDGAGNAYWRAGPCRPPPPSPRPPAPSKRPTPATSTPSWPRSIPRARPWSTPPSLAAPTVTRPAASPSTVPATPT